MNNIVSIPIEVKLQGNTLFAAADVYKPLATQYDHEAQELVFTRPECFAEYDMVLFFQDKENNTWRINNGRGDTFLVPNALTQTLKLTMQIVFFSGDDYRGGTNIVSFHLRPGFKNSGAEPVKNPDSLASLENGAFTHGTYNQERGGFVFFNRQGQEIDFISFDAASGSGSHTNELDLDLPEQLYMHKSQNIELYYENLDAVNFTPEQYTISTGGTGQGHSFARRWGFGSGIPSNNTAITTGRKKIGLVAWTRDGKRYKKDWQTWLNVLDNVAMPEKPYKVMFLGDSYVTQGTAPQTLWRTNAQAVFGSDSAIEFVGTQGTSPNQHEGRGGWMVSNYTSAKSGNPFWDATNKRLSFAYYTQTTGITPDVVCVQLGINSILAIAGGEDAAVHAGEMKKLTDQMLADWPDVNIIVHTPPYMSKQDGIGYHVDRVMYSQFQLDKVVRDYNQALREIVPEQNRLHFTAGFYTFDREYNYTKVNANTPVNTFAPGAVYNQINDCVHPQSAGLRQVFDASFGTWLGHLKPVPAGTYTLKNLLTSPDFSSLEGWGTYPSTGAVVTASNGVAKVTNLPVAPGNFNLFRRNGVAIQPNHLYYGRMYTKSSQRNYSKIDLRFGENAAGRFICSNVTAEWTPISQVLSSSVLSSTSSIAVGVAYYFPSFTAGDVVPNVLQFREPVLYDLTAMFGAGNEPDVAWCDEHLPFVCGSEVLKLS